MLRKQMSLQRRLNQPPEPAKEVRQQFPAVVQNQDPLLVVSTLRRRCSCAGLGVVAGGTGMREMPKAGFLALSERRTYGWLQPLGEKRKGQGS
jgi:hypothetical protein